MMISQTELNTGEKVISNLEVLEPDIADFLCDSSISSILPASEVREVRSDGWILVERISCVGVIIHNWLARVLSWDHVMEDTESIPTARVSSVTSEFSNSFVFWAHIGISMWTDGVDLKVVPVCISV